MDSDFAEAAFSLAKGDMSGVVQTKFGYHIIKVHDKRAPEYAGYDDVKAAIRENLTRKQAQKEVEQLRETLRGKAKITINKDALKISRTGTED